MPKTGQASRARVASTQRSLVVLDVLAAEPSLGTNEIARRTGMAASTVSRQLGTLVEAGLVDRVETTGHYRLGLRLVELGTAVPPPLDVRTLARPPLQEPLAAGGGAATPSGPRDPHALAGGRRPPPPHP